MRLPVDSGFIGVTAMQLEEFYCFNLQGSVGVIGQGCEGSSKEAGAAGCERGRCAEQEVAAVNRATCML